MKKNSIHFIGLFICVSLIILIFLIGINENPVVDNFILIDGKGQTIQEIKVKEIEVNPGSISKTTLNLSTIDSGNYNIKIEFIEEEATDLKKYINLLIEANEDIIHESSLEEVINGKYEISFKSKLEKNIPLKLNIIYEIPLDVGNEIKGLDVKLEIKLIVEKIGL